MLTHNTRNNRYSVFIKEVCNAVYKDCFQTRIRKNYFLVAFCSRIAIKGCFYIKPNLAELMALYGVRSKFPSREAMISWVKEKAADLLSRGPKFVAVSLGADGAVFADGIDSVHVPSKKVEVKSPVGAGDAMTAAIAYGLDSGLHFRDIVRYAMAVSAAACMTEGSNPPTKETIVQLLRQE